MFWWFLVKLMEFSDLKFCILFTLLHNNCNMFLEVWLKNNFILSTLVWGFQWVVKHFPSMSNSWAMVIFVSDMWIFTFLTITFDSLVRFSKFKKLNNLKFYPLCNGAPIPSFPTGKKRVNGILKGDLNPKIKKITHVQVISHCALGENDDFWQYLDRE